jgi:TRAP-type uncharacterized transport system fused permease subunit
MKKFDFYAQLFLTVIIVAALITCFISLNTLFFAALALLLLGIWQLISALIISFNPKFKPHKKQINNYWKASLLSLFIFFFSFFVYRKINNDEMMAIAITGMACGLLTAFYYLYIYKKYFIEKPATAIKTEEVGID